MHSGAVSNTSNSMKRTAAAALYNETGTHSQGNKYNSSDGHSSSDTKNQSLSPSPPEKRSFIVVESPLKLDTIDSAVIILLFQYNFEYICLRSDYKLKA